jgi:uncharacterized delta-60 repeat protein
MSEIGLVRYLVEGSLDLDFAGSGLLTTQFDEGASSAHAVAIDTQDRIVVAGWVDTLDGVQFAFTRFLTDGQLDASFSGNGKARVGFDEGRSLATSVTLDRDGRIVAAGQVVPPAGNAFAVVRLLPNGTPDASFGGTGKVLTEFDEGRGFAMGVSVDSSDRIVAAGFVNAGVPGSLFGLVRYLADGSLDRQFGHDGRVVVRFQGADAALDVTHDWRGRILVVGKAGAGARSDAAAARLRPDGSLDVTFGVNGRAYSDLGGSRGQARAVALSPGNRIVLAGLVHHNFDEFGIARLLSGGDHDQTFSTDGRTSSGFFDTEGAEDGTVDSAGRVVATGYTDTSGEGLVFASARFLENGAPDTTFGLNGQVFTNFTEGTHDRAHAVAIDSQNRIVVAGTVGHPRDWPLRRGPFRAGEHRVRRIPVPNQTPVEAVIYYPAEREGEDTPVAVGPPFGPPFPIGVFGHGNRGGLPCDGSPSDVDDFKQLSVILRHLSRWGFVTISPDLRSAPLNEGKTEILEASMTFLIAEDSRNGSLFKNQLRTTPVTLMGHSAGGGAAVMLAKKGVFDVSTIATLAPSTQTPNDAQAAGAPFLVIVGSRDSGSSGGNAQEVYEAGVPPKHFVLIDGANHFGFTDDLCFQNDSVAAISRNDQQRIAYAYLTAFLQRYVRGEMSNASYLDGTREIEQLEAFGIDVDAEI